MSAPPFMQMYWADYFGDTRHLSCEQHGAYLQLIGSMWLSGGRIASDPKTLAKITGCTASRWARIAAEVLAFFDMSDGFISHRRITLELEKAHEKSIKRAVSGSLGGTAKALKSQKTGLANASDLLKHSPEPELEREIDDDAGARDYSDWSGPRLDALAEQLRQAAGAGLNAASPGLLIVAPILGLLHPGQGPPCELEADILPAIRAAAARARPGSISNWSYFAKPIAEARDQRLTGAPVIELNPNARRSDTHRKTAYTERLADIDAAMRAAAER